DDALVDELPLCIGAGTRDVAGVPDRITRLEQRNLVPDALDDSCRVVTEHARLLFDLRLRRTHLRVDRIDRYRFDSDQQVAPCRLRLGQLDIDQRLRIVDRQVAGQGNGLHATLRSAAVAQCNGDAKRRTQVLGGL